MTVFVLDHTALHALGAGDAVLARLLFGIPRDLGGVITELHRGPRLLVPALCLLHAGRQRARLAQHVTELPPIRIEPADAATVVALCGPLADVSPHIGHAVHTAGRHNASVITTDRDQYPDTVRTVDLHAGRDS